MTTPALPGLSATAWPGAAPADTTVHTDLLGTVRIPTDQIRAAILSGLNRRLLDDFFPTAASGGVRLGRGGSYYRPRTALPAATALARAVAALDEHAPGDAPAVRHALLDNLHNLAAAGAYALWHDLTDRPAPPGDPRPAALERLIAAATTTAAHLHGLPAPGGPLTVPAGDLELLSRTDGGWRTFRELDNHTKIGNELAFLADHLLASRPEITTLLAPLYGSLSLAVAARTVLPARLDRPLDVHLVRIGFHDQASVSYLDTTGAVLQRPTAPGPYRQQLADAVAGATVLVVDDNVGYGDTLRAAANWPSSSAAGPSPAASNPRGPSTTARAGTTSPTPPTCRACARTSTTASTHA